MEVSLGYNEQQPDEPSLSPQNMQSSQRPRCNGNQATGLAQILYNIIDMISWSLNSTRTHVLPLLPLDIITIVICYLSINIKIVYNSDPDLNT